jgi:hypothetical protein
MTISFGTSMLKEAREEEREYDGPFGGGSRGLRDPYESCTIFSHLADEPEDKLRKSRPNGKLRQENLELRNEIVELKLQILFLEAIIKMLPK